MLDTTIPVNNQPDQHFQLERDLTLFLAIMGWQELLTYSHVSEELVKLSDHALDQHFRIKDPLTIEHQFMRRDIWPSLVAYIQEHAHTSDRSVFELGMAYHPTTDENHSADHELRLSLASSKSYVEVISDLAQLFSRVYVEQPSWIIDPTDTFSREGVEIQTGEIKINNEHVGTVRHLHGITVIEIIWKRLMSQVRQYPTYQPILGYQPVIEDITVSIKEGESAWQVLHQLHQLPDAQSVHLIDQYQANYTYRIRFFSRERQLSTQDVQSVITSFTASRKQ